jgi:hypothetical protein
MKVLFYAIAIFTLISCSKKSDVLPEGEESFFPGEELIWPDAEDGRTILRVSICKDTLPANYDIDVYSFATGTRLEDNAAIVLTPEVAGGTDNDNLNQLPDPESTYSVQAHLIGGAGKAYSHYNKKKEFGISVESNAVIILAIRDAAGEISHISGIETTNINAVEACFSPVK